MQVIKIDDNLKYNYVSYPQKKKFFELTDSKEVPTDLPSYNIEGIRDINRGDDSNWRYGKEENHKTLIEKRFSQEKGKGLCAEAIKTVMRSKEYKDILSTALTYRKKNTLVDAGSRISIPHVIAGDEKYFLKIKNASKPTAKIGINMCVSAMVSDEQLMEIAIRAIPMVYALETAGICTEVWMLTAVRNLYENAEAPISLFEVKLKSASERFSWTSIAPIFLCGTYRHNFFKAWLLQGPEAEYGYGQPFSSSQMENYKNFGYTSIISNQGPGPVQNVQEVFKKIRL